MRNKIYNFLRWSEKYTKADMIYIAKGGFWVTFGQSITSILSLVLIVAFANLLPKETYGLYRYIFALAGILNIFTLTGMNSAVAQAVAAGNKSVLKSSVIYQFKWHVMAMTAFALLSGYYFINGNTVFAVSFLILGLFVPATLAFNTYSAYLEGRKEFRLANILSVISTFIYTVGMLVTMFFTENVLWLIGVYAATTFLASFVFFLYTLHKFTPPEATGMKKVLKYGRELTYIKFMAPVVSQIDKIILAHFWGPAQLATYMLALVIPARVILLIKSWVSIGFPKFAAKTIEEINTVFYRRIFQGVLIGTILAVSYILISPSIFKYLLPQYLDSVFFSQILALGFIFALPSRYISLLLNAQKLSRIILIDSIILSVIRTVLYILLGISGGIMGIVIAHVLYLFIGMIINIIIWRTVASN